MGRPKGRKMFQRIFTLDNASLLIIQKYTREQGLLNSELVRIALKEYDAKHRGAE